MTAGTSARPELGIEVDAAGVRTNALVEGAGPPLLLIHGSGPGVTAYANWRQSIPVLARRFKVIAPDLLGFGFTQRPQPAMTADVDAWVAHLLAVLEALDVRQAGVVGNSLGGAIALRLAARHPDRVHRLVLMGSVGVPHPISPGLEAVWGYQPSFEAMRALLDLFAHARELVTDELAQVRYEASIGPGFQEAFSALFPAPRQRWVDALVTPDDEIRAIRQPALLIHGREDRVIPLSTSLRLLELLPAAQLHVFGRCGHWSQIEWAEDFNTLVGDFLART